MSKKLEFPIAKIRDDGTPAIWLTFGNWLLLKDGIARKYIELREDEGRRAARAELRKEFPDSWHLHPSLESWGFLDSTAAWGPNAREVLDIYRVGAEAHPSTIDYGQGGPFTAEKLAEVGDKRASQACEAERALLRKDERFATKEAA